MRDLPGDKLLRPPLGVQIVGLAELTLMTCPSALATSYRERGQNAVSSFRGTSRTLPQISLEDAS